MPELGFIYFTGLVACLALTILYVFLRGRRRETEAAKTVQLNLRKIGKYWSDNRDAVVDWDKCANTTEAKKSQKAVALTGAVLSLLSWAGVGFLLIIMLSERFFARSRRERRLFSSQIAANPSMDAAQIREELDRLDVCNAAPSEALTVG